LTVHELDKSALEFLSAPRMISHVTVAGGGPRNEQTELNDDIRLRPRSVTTGGM